VQIFNSFYFKKETKIAPWGWVPGPDDCGSIDSINLPLLWRHPQKTQIQNFALF